MSGKNAGKFDICFYHYCPANRSSKKRGWLRAFLIGAAAQGRRFGSAGLLDGLHQGPGRSCSSAEIFIQELQAEQPPGGGAGAGKLQPVST